MLVELRLVKSVLRPFYGKLLRARSQRAFGRAMPGAQRESLLCIPELSYFPEPFVCQERWSVHTGTKYSILSRHLSAFLISIVCSRA